MDGAEAFRALTARASRYAGERTDLAGYHEAPLSVPDSGAKAIPIREFQRGYERELLDHPSSFFHQQPDEELLNSIKPYWDPTLAENGPEYREYINRSLANGMVGLSARKPLEEVAVFFVWKLSLIHI